MAETPPAGPPKAAAAKPPVAPLPVVPAPDTEKDALKAEIAKLRATNRSLLEGQKDGFSYDNRGPDDARKEAVEKKGGVWIGHAQRTRNDNRRRRRIQLLQQAGILTAEKTLAALDEGMETVATGMKDPEADDKE